MLCGVGVVVEIDECALVRRKYNRGHLVRTQWVFGGYEVCSKKSFLFEVENRTHEVLIPLIQQYILSVQPFYLILLPSIVFCRLLDMYIIKLIIQLNLLILNMVLIQTILKVDAKI